MTEPLDLAQLKAQWVAVLDELERSHRTAWLALFDARLASLADGVVTLDFADREKFAGSHGFELDSRPDFLDALADACEQATGHRLRFVS
jgi:hypothetical protein